MYILNVRFNINPFVQLSILKQTKIKHILFSKLCLGIAIGMAGSLMMIFLMTDPFDLQYSGGFLLIVLLIAIIVCAIKAYDKVGKGKINYWNRVEIGTLAYSTTIITESVYQMNNSDLIWTLNRSELVSTTVIMLIFGFGVSMIVAKLLK